MTCLTAGPQEQEPQGPVPAVASLSGLSKCPPSAAAPTCPMPLRSLAGPSQGVLLSGDPRRAPGCTRGLGWSPVGSVFPALVTPDAPELAVMAAEQDFLRAGLGPALGSLHPASTLGRRRAGSVLPILRRSTLRLRPDTGPGRISRWVVRPNPPTVCPHTRPSSLSSVHAGPAHCLPARQPFRPPFHPSARPPCHPSTHAPPTVCPPARPFILPSISLPVLPAVRPHSQAWTTPPSLGVQSEAPEGPWQILCAVVL